MLFFTEWDGIDYNFSCILKNYDCCLLKINDHFVVYVGMPFPAAQSTRNDCSTVANVFVSLGEIVSNYYCVT